MPLSRHHFTRSRRPGFRRPRLRQLVVPLEAAICICAAGAFGYYFYNEMLESPNYKVGHIVVDGTSAVTPAEVRRAAGVTTSDSLLFLDREAVAARVAALPYVASAEIQRELPNTLTITLVERKPVATLVAGRRCFLVDREGYVLEQIDLSAPQEGPLITNVPALGVVTVGEQLTHPALVEALHLWEAYASAPISEEVTLSEISAAGPMELIMYWEEAPYEVRWGRSDYQKQAERLSILWLEKGGQLPCQEYLDLRFDEDLVCR